MNSEKSEGDFEDCILDSDSETDFGDTEEPIEENADSGTERDFAIGRMFFVSMHDVPLDDIKDLIEVLLTESFISIHPPSKNIPKFRISEYLPTSTLTLGERERKNCVRRRHPILLAQMLAVTREWNLTAEDIVYATQVAIFLRFVEIEQNTIEAYEKPGYIFFLAPAVNHARLWFQFMHSDSTSSDEEEYPGE